RRDMPFDPLHAPDPRTLSLDRADALLLIVDVQKKLAAAMDPAGLAALEKNAAVLIRAARRLGVPVVATEQYPKGLGHTVAALREGRSHLDQHRSGGVRPAGRGRHARIQGAGPAAQVAARLARRLAPCEIV